MKRLFHRGLRVCLALLTTCCLFCSSALAEIAFVAANAPVYAAPDANAASLNLPAGTKVEALAEKGGWTMIRLKGRIAYMQNQALAKVNVIGNKTVYIAADAPVYQSCSSASRRYGILPAGTALRLLATVGDWAYVGLGSRKGYVPLSALAMEAPAIQLNASDASAKPEAAEEKRLSAYATAEGAKVFASWSTGSAVLATLPLNTEVAVTAAKNGWCRVEAGGITAYMRASDLSLNRVSVPEAATATAQASAPELKYGDKGETVMALQTRLKELGYFGGNIGGNYLEQTQSAVQAFQTAAGLAASGVADAATLRALASGDAPKAPEPTGASTMTPARGTAREMDWWTSGIQTIFARETVAQITDIETGISWREIRKGGSNHADVQPCTAADTAAMKRACGSWSWSRRAIWVTINGVNYAASMNCMPHGSGSITDNNFPGHHCIHFTNSRTHGTNRVCPQHQAAIKRAAVATR